MTNLLTTFFTITLLLAAVGVYFLPTFVALERKNHPASVGALNFFLGWTLVGWVIALVMALWTTSRAPNGRVAA